MSSTNSIRSKVEGDISVSTTPQVLKNPEVFNVALPDDTTEWVVSLPSGTVAYEMKVRSGSNFKIGHQLGGPYLTVSTDCVQGLDPSVAFSLYVVGGRVGGDTLEYRTWKS